jgi:hypothetical protein
MKNWCVPRREVGREARASWAYLDWLRWVHPTAGVSQRGKRIEGVRRATLTTGGFARARFSGCGSELRALRCNLRSSSSSVAHRAEEANGLLD